MRMKTVMNQSHDGWLLKMISRTDPVILPQVSTCGLSSARWLAVHWLPVSGNSSIQRSNFLPKSGSIKKPEACFRFFFCMNRDL